MHVNSKNHRRLAHSLFIIAMVEESHVETHWQVQCVTPQSPLQGYDNHFTPQAQKLKVETTQTFVLLLENYQLPITNFLFKVVEQKF